MGCVYLLASNDEIFDEGKFHLIDGSNDFAAGVHVIKEVILDAFRKGLVELDIFFRLEIGASEDLFSGASSQSSCRD